MIYVCNVKDSKSTHYVGRKASYKESYGADYSCLGNPFGITKKHNREAVIRMYKFYFREIVLLDRVLKKNLDKLKKLSKTQDIYLGCFCSPESCHAEIIKSYLEKK